MSLAWAHSYAEEPEVQAWVSQAAEANPSLDPIEMMALLSKVEFTEAVVQSVKAPAEKTLTWNQYRSVFLPARLDSGRAFIRENQKALNQAERAYGVPGEIIASIIGIESNYGQNYGKYNILASLASLGFDPSSPRQAFFRKELLEYFLLLKEHPDLDPAVLNGSYAGAMGWIQFMPSSFRRYAQDGDHNGRIDIWHDPSDMIFSIANYLKENHWQRGDPYILPVRYEGDDPALLSPEERDRLPEEPSKTYAEWSRLGFSLKNPEPRAPSDLLLSVVVLKEPEGNRYWLVSKNFRVIASYNPHLYYTAAVALLAFSFKN